MAIQTPQTQFNLPDLLVALGLILLIPLFTYLILSSSDRDGEKDTRDSSVLPLTLAEADEIFDQYRKMYLENANLFYTRSKIAKNSIYRSQEQAWSRSVLLRCKEGVSELLERARKRPASAGVRGRVSQIQELLRNINYKLSSLPATLPPSPQAAP